MRIRQRSSGYFIIMLLIISISNHLAITKVAAPPTGGSISSGIIISTGSEIKITEACINMSILPLHYLDYYRIHVIQLQGLLNMTNPSTKNASILLLYNPAWQQYSSVLNSSTYEASIDGAPLSFTNHTLANLTHPRDLPEEFQDRFPGWMYNHEVIWDDPIDLPMLNLSFWPHQSIELYFQDSIVAYIGSGHYSAVGFGFGSDQVENDQTRIRFEMTVQYGSLFVDLNPYPSDYVVESQSGSNFTYTWNVQPPYSLQFLNGVIPEPIGAGFYIQMMVTEYLLPTPDTTTTHQITPKPFQLIEAMTLFMTSILIVFIAFILWKKGN